MRSISLPAGRWGISEPDGLLHRLPDSSRWALCGRSAKPLQATRVPQSLPVCPECRARSLGHGPCLARPQSLARAVLAALLRTGGTNDARN